MREVEFCEISLGAEVLIYMFAVPSMYLKLFWLAWVYKLQNYELYVIVLCRQPICLQIVFHVPLSSDCLGVHINLPPFHSENLLCVRLACQPTTQQYCSLILNQHQSLASQQYCFLITNQYQLSATVKRTQRLQLNASKEKQICRSKFSKSALPSQMHCYNSNASETSEPWNFRHECKNWRDKPDSRDHLEQTTDCTWISKTRIEVEGVLAVPLGHVIQQGDEVCLILVSLRRLSSQ